MTFRGMVHVSILQLWPALVSTLYRLSIKTEALRFTCLTPLPKFWWQRLAPRG